MPLIIIGIIFSFISHFLLTGMAVAETCEVWVAKATSVKGRVEVRRAGQTQWASVQRHDIFCPGDIIRVLERSNLAIAAQNETNHRLDQNTTITMVESAQKRTFLLNLRQGAAYFFSRFPRSLKVITPFVDAGVEGTEFFVRVERDQTFLSVFEGTVAATSPAGSLSLTTGQSAVIKVGQVPERRVVVRPRDAVQWALYYPPILDLRPLDSPVRTVAQAVVRQSLQSYLDGDVPTALDSMMSAPQGITEPHFFTYRAALLLTVGRVDEARTDIEAALKLDPDNSRAFALQSIIAVTQDKKDHALELARKAVKLEPNSSVARVALSYAQQVHFDLQGALASLKEAVTLPPENALTWARLAELWLSVGALKKALRAAQRAVALNPGVARTQTVLGFAFLTQIQVQKAKTAFEQAIQLDQSAPLPRLGLGLAQIRQGKLKEGRGEIEIAASLDPNNSLIRSYLGKAYFEEKRDKLARDQLSTAKGLDPKDPTPWFYDAIRKQAVNRPVEALQDLQKSIELNDNRAVYRSRLLLDEDRAARSASLARIYNDLGFQQRALAEGWQALNIDPSTSSVHRFLSDSYVALPRHEIARVSELLQSQLLQPLNITPVQPQLAEKDLFILSSAGSADPSLNEFHSLFTRNRFSLLASGVVGGNDSGGDEVVLSGVADRLSYSFGQFYYKTEGFRENNDLEQDMFNAFLQAELSHKASVQAEFRYSQTNSGDVRQLFDPNFFSPILREKEIFESVRLGFRYAFAPHSDVITSLIYRQANFKANIEPGVDLKIDEDGYLAEVQHLFRSKRFHVTSGIGYVSTTEKEVFNLLPFPSQVMGNGTHHTNVYAYLQLNVLQDVTLTLGGSADFFEEDDINRNQFNPKLGLTWHLLPGTTLRAAIFRVLKRTLISSQTIEPTQVAGFNQFFDDNDSTDAWRYGIAVDQKFSPHLYAGAEFSKRVSDVPRIVLQPMRRVETFEKEEQLARAYLYWTPWAWLALKAEYQYEDLDFDPEARNEQELAKVQTHRFSSGVGFFHPMGFRARLKATYIDQAGKFRDATGVILPDDDQFWIVDASIGYRLPKRWGLITVEIRNVFDQKFRFQDTDPATPTISPERLTFARFTLAY